jgi:hypothetical protein
MLATCDGEPPNTLGFPEVDVRTRIPLAPTLQDEVGEAPPRTGVKMAVEVNHGYGPVGAVNGLQQGEGDGVVAAERDDSGQGLAVLGGTLLVCVGRRRSREDAEVALLDLVESPGVVVPRRGGSEESREGRRTTDCTYEVTGMSPQSRTLAQLLKGFVSRGTL